MMIVGFVSNCLLCYIFWQLGKTVEEEEDDEDYDVVSVEVEDFDEDAHL